MKREKICSLLKKGYDVVVLEETDSTNEEIKRRVRAGIHHDIVVVSDSQNAGKGRNGRCFFSPKGTGIYLSVLFDVRNERVVDSVMLTTQAAVAVAHAVSQVCHRETQIKWVNDVYLEDKKICGILAEAVTDVNSGRISHVIVGIGINVYEPDRLPDDLSGVFGCIFSADERIPGLRDRLAATVVNELTDYYEAMPDRHFLVEYRNRSNVIGRSIMYGAPGADTFPGEDWKSGTAVDIDDDGGLVVERPDGTVVVLRTGEISIRLNGTPA
ncbi:MAG: biotin--[acetyl-CoA-carboxylase] ligase [Eubacterium sp.]|nr:biotin--[acetyl-CoA-carboxylase] ligase [Eubacterium sp.]